MISSCLALGPVSDIAIFKLLIQNPNLEGPSDRLGQDERPIARDRSTGRLNRDVENGSVVDS